MISRVSFLRRRQGFLSSQSQGSPEYSSSEQGLPEGGNQSFDHHPLERRAPGSLSDLSASWSIRGQMGVVSFPIFLLRELMVPVRTPSVDLS